MSEKPRSVFISIDMEGISGIVDWKQVRGDQREYDTGRRLMVGDLNAAIEGTLEAGAKEIAVSDAHGGMRNLQPEEVNEAAYLIRGSPKPLAMMEGIGEDYDAALYVGYHSMRGTENGILCHTISGRAVDAIYVNGRETGEFGLNAALAGWYGVPSVFVSGDAAVAAEAKEFVPNISTAIVKWGLGRYSAKCLHPKKSTALIKKMVKVALANIGDVEPLRVDEPVEVKIRYFTSTMADIVSLLPYVERLDGRSVKAIFDEYPTANQGLRASIYLAGTAERK